MKLETVYKKEDTVLIIKITEELDHHTVEKLRRKADYEIERYIPRKVILDFNRVSFMDSTGIGLILGRYKNVSILGGILEVTNVSKQVEKILNMSGLSKIIEIKEACA